MAVTKDILGNKCITVDDCVSIPIERYDELVKKEAYYDEIMKFNKKVLFLEQRPLEEVNKYGN